LEPALRMQSKRQSHALSSMMAFTMHSWNVLLQRSQLS
jgi:hypothetical protein